MQVFEGHLPVVLGDIERTDGATVDLEAHAAEVGVAREQVLAVPRNAVPAGGQRDAPEFGRCVERRLDPLARARATGGLVPRRRRVAVERQLGRILPVAGGDERRGMHGRRRDRVADPQRCWCAGIEPAGGDLLGRQEGVALGTVAGHREMEHLSAAVAQPPQLADHDLRARRVVGPGGGGRLRAPQVKGCRPNDPTQRRG